MNREKNAAICLSFQLENDDTTVILTKAVKAKRRRNLRVKRLDENCEEESASSSREIEPIAFEFEGKTKLNFGCHIIKQFLEPFPALG